jgi:hypothetical protein
MRRFLHQRHSGQSQAAFHGEPFRRQPGRPDPARQAVLLLRQRMGSYRLADRLSRHRSHRSVPAICSAATAAGRHGFHNGFRYRPAPQLVPFYQNMFSLYRNTNGTPLAVLGVRSTATAVTPPGRRPTATDAPTGRASRIPATITNRCRRRASTTTSTGRTSHGTGFRPTPVCRLPTDPINPLFNAISPQPLYSFAAGYTHVFSPSW